MNSLTRLGAAAGIAVLALGLTGPAQAGKYVHNDPAGDVQVDVCTWTTPPPTPDPAPTPTTEPDPTATESPAPEPSTTTAPEPEPGLDDGCTTESSGVDASWREGDITRFVVRHTARKVILRTSFRELTRTDGFSVTIGAIRTNERVNRMVSVFFDSEFAPNGEADLSRLNGRPVRCHVGKSIDFTANVIEVRIPRKCLSSPRWVKVGVGQVSLSMTGDDANGSDAIAADDALSSGVGENLTWSPRVRRG
jgi:hypothetical protein